MDAETAYLMNASLGSRSEGILQQNEHGWTASHNLRLDFRFGLGDPDRLREYATELVALAPDALFSGGGSGRAAIARLDVGKIYSTMAVQRLRSLQGGLRWCLQCNPVWSFSPGCSWPAWQRLHAPSSRNIPSQPTSPIPIALRRTGRPCPQA